MHVLTSLRQSFKFGLLPIMLALLFLGLSLFALQVVAETPLEAEVEFYVQSRSSDQPLTVGDQLTFHLVVTHPTGARVALPQVDRAWGNFRVIEQTPPEEVDNNDGSATTSKNIIVTTFQPGYYKTPDLVITHRKPDGTIEELASPVIQLNVSSVITDSEDDELRDLKNQANLAVPSIWLWVLGGVALVIILITLIIGARWWLARRQRKPVIIEELLPPPVIDSRPPEVIALAELQRIEAMHLPIQQQWKEHYSLVSACMRQYLENRYKITALEQTTTEINHALRKNSLPIGHVSNLMGILHESDLVKFARYAPNEELAAELIKKAREGVILTTVAKKEDVVMLEKSV